MTPAPAGSFAYGYDDVAYQRQAELIRERGPLRGLDTRIEGPGVKPLMAVARATGLPDGDWHRILGPHCHHVDAHSGRLIARYPPGTPLVLSLFPRGTAGFGAYLVFAVAGCLAGPLFLTLAAPSIAQVTVAALLATEACRYSFMPSSWGSYSVGISAGLAALLAVRLPNAFVAAGAVLAFAGRLGLHRPRTL